MGQEIKYKIKKSVRAKQMRLAVYCDGTVVATAPHYFENNFIEKWVRQKGDWILRKIKYFEKKGFRAIPKRSRKEYLQYKKQAGLLARNRLEYYSQIYGISYGRISIRNQKTRWGSCSRKGNLSFNYKIALIPLYQADYIIIHELCHIKEFNHSQNFWSLIAQAIPDYKNIRKQVKNP